MPPLLVDMSRLGNSRGLCVDWTTALISLMLAVEVEVHTSDETAPETCRPRCLLALLVL